MIDALMPMIKQFLPFAQERMGFKDPPRLFVRKDAQNAQNPLGKTAFYDPQGQSVTLYITDRHPKDVMRSLSHELVHHTQNCNGEFKNVGPMGDGYAQNDDHLREMERQAYEIGNLCFRDWEDSIKHTIYFEHLQKGVENIMSTKEWKNGELKSLLSEAWGFKMDLSKLNEGTGPSASDSDEEAEEDVEGKDPSGKGKGWEKKGLEEDGAKKGEQSATRVDYPDAKDPDEDTGSGESAGDQSKTKGDYEKLKEDSGEEEGWHDWKNEHADDDHIREIEHHLRALKDDRDYERRGAEYDHDKYEDEGDPDLEERRARGRRSDRNQRGAVDARQREALIRRAVKEALKKSITKK